MKIDLKTYDLYINTEDLCDKTQPPSIFNIKTSYSYYARKIIFENPDGTVIVLKDRLRKEI